MGFKQSSSSDFKASKTDLFGAVLAGFGIWTKPSQVAKLDFPQAQAASNNVYPLRVIRVKDADIMPKMAGRMVISGRISDVCAELDRLAA